MNAASSRSRLPVAPAAVLLSLVVAGLALFVWLAPRTPVAAVAAAERADQ